MSKELALKSKSNEYAKKTVGVVEIITGKNVAKLTMIDPNKKFKSTDSKEVKIKLSDFPDVPKIKPNNRTPMTFRVRMNEDDTAVEAINPARGMHPAKVVSLGPKDGEDADPVPQLKFFNKGKSNENSHLEFWAVYRITSGFYKGCEAAYYLHYKFEEDAADPGLTQFNFNTENPKATRGQQLLDWGYYHGGGAPGIWGEPIEWDDDTILPELQDRVLDADVEVNLIFDKGYIQSIQPLDDDGYVEDDDDEPDFLKEPEEDDLDEDEDDVEPEPAPKKRKPRRKAVVEDDDDL